MSSSEFSSEEMAVVGGEKLAFEGFRNAKLCTLLRQFQFAFLNFLCPSSDIQDQTPD